jgi:hypothetical protein
VTHTIPASETAQDCKSKSYTSDNFWCAGNLVTFGQACKTTIFNKPAPPNKVTDLQKASPIVGWESHHDPGSPGFPCPESVSGASRAYVNFAIFPTLTGKADRIVSAQLKWSPSSKHWAEPNTTFKECYSRAFEATGAWQSFATPGEWIAEWELPEPTDFVPTPSLDVSNIIRRWAKGDQQYFGFFFTSFGEKPVSGIDDWCLTTLNDLRLEVMVNDPIVPWPSS